MCIRDSPNDATDVNQLLKHADGAMYQAKDSGRNTARFYTCLLYTSDAADERSSVDLGGRRIIKKKKNMNHRAHH